MTALLEICAGSYEGALTAARYGAVRVELCSGLDEGGLTPSAGLIRSVCALEGIRKHVLIRPRGGDFLYTPEELRIMEADIRMAHELGADGVVVGALTADGDVDEEAAGRFVEAAGGMSVTFHRAFDLCADPFSALESVIRLGFHRLLTSGRAATAEKGIPLLKQLVERAGSRISVMPGCGVGPGNAAHILRETGAREIHASARERMDSRMRYRLENVTMGKSDSDEYSRLETSAEKVRGIVQALAGFSS